MKQYSHYNDYELDSMIDDIRNEIFLRKEQKRLRESEKEELIKKDPDFKFIMSKRDEFCKSYDLKVKVETPVYFCSECWIKIDSLFSENIIILNQEPDILDEDLSSFSYESIQETEEWKKAIEDMKRQFEEKIKKYEINEIVERLSEKYEVEKCFVMKIFRYTYSL